MDPFRRFLNNHVFLESLKYFNQESAFKTQVLLGTRLYEQIQALGDSDILTQKINTQKQQDNLETKLKAINELLNAKQLTEYINDNLWTVEEAYQAIIILFDQGEYEQAYKIVELLTSQVDQVEKLAHLKNSFFWARLNCKLIAFLQRREQPTLDAITTLQEDESKLSFKERADLLHSGLLICFIANDFTGFLEIFGGEPYLEVVHTIAPQLLYYYAVAGVIKNNVQSYGVSKSPLLTFINELIGKFNFEAANQLINQIGEEIEKDLFIKNQKQKLINASQLFYFQTYIKIYNGISIKQFAKYLQLNEEEAELWLVKAIRTLNIQAKIEGDRIIIQKYDISSQNTQVLKQLRDLVPKANLLSQNLQRIIK